MLPATAVTVLVNKAPHLSELLPADAQKAFSATNREFKETFTFQVQVVTVFCNKDIECGCPVQLAHAQHGHHEA